MMDQEEILQRSSKSLRLYGAIPPGNPPDKVRHVFVVFLLQRIMGVVVNFKNQNFGIRTRDSGTEQRENFDA